MIKTDIKNVSLDKLFELEGMNIKEIAQKLDIRESTVYEWIRKYKKGAIDVLKNKKRRGNHRNLSNVLGQNRKPKLVEGICDLSNHLKK